MVVRRPTEGGGLARPLGKAAELVRPAQMVPSQSHALHVPSLSPANACAGRCDAAPMKAAPVRRRSAEGLHKLDVGGAAT